MGDLGIHLLLLLLLPPLLPGIIGKTKALFAGRVGPPLLQAYFDLWRLLRKGTVQSPVTTWLFRAGPVVSLATVLLAGLLLPFGSHRPPLSFTGDLLLFAYLLALGRFFTMAAALDTGSSFEGMGAAREATFACLAEPALFFALLTLARSAGALSLQGMLAGASLSRWLTGSASMLLLTGALFIVLLVENCRIPFDDPNTHLELTMVHEVMVLDHSGPAFGLVVYGAAVKLFVLGALFLQVALPLRSGEPLWDWGLFVLGICLLAVVIGVVESVMARLRLLRIPQLLVAAGIFAAFALLLTMLR